LLDKIRDSIVTVKLEGAARPEIVPPLARFRRHG
jgi:hypothetical protein